MSCASQLSHRPRAAGAQQRWAGRSVAALPQRLAARTRSSVVTRSSALPKLSPLDDSFDAKHRFTNYANWLVPDAVMLGRYPFIEPSRCTTREQGEDQLSQILGAGINTFVCLQDEIPAQDHLKLGGQNGFIPYKPTAELILAALNGPPPMELVDGGLRNLTLNQFLPPNRHHKEQQQNYKPKTLHFLHSPIVDLGLPSTAALDALLVDLRQRLEAGEKLYIHCWGGRGRSGTVGACLLVTAYGLSVEEALDRVGKGYECRQDPQTSSPETPEQYAFVREYCRAKARK